MVGIDCTRFNTVHIVMFIPVSCKLLTCVVAYYTTVVDMVPRTMRTRVVCMRVHTKCKKLRTLFYVIKYKFKLIVCSPPRAMYVECAKVLSLLRKGTVLLPWGYTPVFMRLPAVQ